jgi:hypothetical protein
MPDKEAFPEPPPPGQTERALACPELDEARVRRWVARYSGATPFTRDQKHFLHVKHADGGAALYWLLEGNAGPSPAPYDGDWHAKWMVAGCGIIQAPVSLN